MRAKISRKELLGGVQRALGVIEKRNTMPVLSNLLLQIENGAVSLYATDLQTHFSSTHSAQIDTPGAVTLSVKYLSDILRELTGETIEIFTDGDDNKKEGWVKIESEKSRFKIPSLPVDDFPLLPSKEDEVVVPIPASTLSTLIKKTVFAAGENSLKYVLSGVLIQVDHKIRMVAADGHRLLLSEAKLRTETEEDKTVQVILPKKAVTEIMKLLDEASEADGAPTLFIGKNMAGLRWGRMTLSSRMIEGTYPNYKQVIPVGNNRKAVTSKAELVGALRRVSLLAREKTYAVRFELSESEGGRLMLTAHNSDTGEAEEAISATFTGEPISAVFNSRYLLEILNAVEGSDVVFEFKDGTSPVLVREDLFGFLAVIMPIRA
jgi:DNA polymerase-3 subunit beta